jgi:hypothetical protein
VAAEDDFDLSAVYEEMDERSKQKRQGHRDRAPKLLKDAGIDFSEHNLGAHIVVFGKGETIDFWPGTGRWTVRGAGEAYKRTKFGIFKLIKHMKGEK